MEVRPGVRACRLRPCGALALAPASLHTAPRPPFLLHTQSNRPKTRLFTLAQADDRPPAPRVRVRLPRPRSDADVLAALDAPLAGVPSLLPSEWERPVAAAGGGGGGGEQRSRSRSPARTVRPTPPPPRRAPTPALAPTPMLPPAARPPPGRGAPWRSPSPGVPSGGTPLAKPPPPLTTQLAVGPPPAAAEADALAREGAALKRQCDESRAGGDRRGAPTAAGVALLLAGGAKFLAAALAAEPAGDGRAVTLLDQTASLMEAAARDAPRAAGAAAPHIPPLARALADALAAACLGRATCADARRVDRDGLLSEVALKLPTGTGVDPPPHPPQPLTLPPSLVTGLARLIDAARRARRAASARSRARESAASARGAVAAAPAEAAAATAAAVDAVALLAALGSDGDAGALLAAARRATEELVKLTGC